MEPHVNLNRQKPELFERPQCPRAVLVGLGAGGQRVLQQVARRVGELRPDSLTLTRSVIHDEDGNWHILSGPDMAERRLPDPAPPPPNRQEAHRFWQEHVATGCHALQHAAFQVMDPHAVEALGEKGFDICTGVEIYIVGDLVDPLCSGALLPLLYTFKSQFLPDITTVVSVLVSIARLSGLALQAHEQAMAYAALKELNYATSQAAWYPAEGQPQWGRLVDHCYLVDQVSEGDFPTALPQSECALEIIGGFLTGALLSSLRSVEEAAYLFGPRWPGTSERPEEVGEVASLGYAAISMPLSAIAAYIGHLEARCLISALLQPDEAKDEQPAEPACPDLLERLDLAQPAIETRLKRVAAGGSLAVRIEGLTIEGVRVSRWADHLAQVTESYERRQWRHLLDAVGINEQAETERVLNAIREAVDSAVHSQPAGWQLAEEMIKALDAAVEERQSELPHLTPLPDLSQTARDLRCALLLWRPLPALIPHIVLVVLLALWLALTVPVGWFPGVSMVILTLVWLGWSRAVALSRARKCAQAQIELHQRYFEVRLENRVLAAIARLYSTIRETLGYTILPPDGPAETEMAALRRWRDTLADAAQALADDPVPTAVTLPYGERPAVRPEQYGAFYQTYTRWTPADVATEFLVTSRQQDPVWHWRRLGVGMLLDQGRTFCARKYRWAFDRFGVDVAASLEQDGPSPDHGLPAILRQLRLRSQVLVRRRQHFHLGSESRRRFLLLHETNKNPLAALGAREDLVPVTGSPSSYLAVAQVQLGVAIPDLLVIPALKSVYDDLEEKAIAHGEIAWADLPDLEEEEVADLRPQEPLAP